MCPMLLCNYEDKVRFDCSLQSLRAFLQFRSHCHSFNKREVSSVFSALYDALESISSFKKQYAL